MPDEDDEVRSEVLEDEAGDEYVVEQENTGPGNMKGGGEWPDPDTPPEAPAAGSDPAEGDAIDANRRRNAVEDGREQHLKDVLEADPVRGGSKATPD
jgi:hypothetical protein